MTLRWFETRLVGKFNQGPDTKPDPVTRRIFELTSTYLEEVGSDPSGWITLFRDPRTRRLWVREYPQGEMHGGGPPQLRKVTASEAAALGISVETR